MKRKFILLLVLVALVGSLYLIRNPKRTIETLYQGEDQAILSSLDSFRRIPTKVIDVEGITWRYVSLGHGTENILFLHGMAGSYDIWWNQINAFKSRYHVISVTYPPVNSLKALGNGINIIVDHEGIHATIVIGSSLGGYLAQYLVSAYPDRFNKAVFGNTFPPNDVYEQKNAGKVMAARFLPEWMVMYAFRGNVMSSVIPASEYSPITQAYLLEQSYGGMSKDQFLARYYCVIDKFKPRTALDPSKKILIIESNNDPLIYPELRQRIKAMYPAAKVFTFRGKGHFPYLNEARMYNKVIDDFINKR